MKVRVNNSTLREFAHANWLISSMILMWRTFIMRSTWRELQSSKPCPNTSASVSGAKPMACLILQSTTQLRLASMDISSECARQETSLPWLPSFISLGPYLSQMRTSGSAAHSWTICTSCTRDCSGDITMPNTSAWSYSYGVSSAKARKVSGSRIWTLSISPTCRASGPITSSTFSKMLY